MQELDLAATRAAKRFDRRHPVLSGLVSSVLFASIGLLSVVFAAHLIRTEVSVLLAAAMIEALFALLQAREDVRHPEKRVDRVRNSMTMAWGPRRK